ncbi:MAG: MBL fold metallo-hydrolase [Bacteroidaceae bacterium]|nr:MBL fold metallo-hydrolase [Bacteroidaceae bacterium]
MCGKDIMKLRILIDNTEHENCGDLICEWGLCIYIEYEGHKILLDAGQKGGIIKNAQMMGIDLSEVEFGVLSHAHYDHSDGIDAFFEINKTAPFYIRESTKENCYAIDEEPPVYIGLRHGMLSDYGERFVRVDGDYKITDGVWLIPHKTPHLEKIGIKSHMCVMDEAGNLVPDDFSHEQSLVFETSRGLVVLNSCSHGGADNIITEVANTFPGEPISALIGGFHLYETSDEDVRALANRMKALTCEAVYTGHCTGQKAYEILRDEIGAGVVHQIYSGLEIDL